MQKMIIFSILLLVLICFANSCVDVMPPGIAVSTSYPRDDFPIYDSSLVIEYNKYADGYKLRAGSGDRADDVAKFYEIFFGDDAAQAVSDAYVLSGFYNGYLYNIDISGAQNWDERAFSSIFTIDIEQAYVDYGSEPAISWQKELGSGKYLSCTAPARDGGFITAGCIKNEPGAKADGSAPEPDAWAAYIDATGALQWEVSFGGPFGDEVCLACPAKDGAVYLCGYTRSDGGGISGWHQGEENGEPSADIWVAKLSASGNLLWQRCLGGSGREYPYSMRQTADGGLTILGESNSTDGDVASWTKRHGALSPGTNIWVVKLDAQGALQWENSVGGSKSDFADSFVTTSDGGVVLCGQTASPDGDVTGWHEGMTKSGGASRDVWIVCLDPGGRIKWQKTMGGSMDEIGRDIKKTADGGYVAAANKRIPDGDGNDITGNYDLWLIKFTYDGKVDWQTSLGGRSCEDVSAVLPAGDGYVALGVTRSADVPGWHEGYDAQDGQGYYDIWAVKVSPGGQMLWQIALGGGNEESFVDAIITIDGGFLLLGQTKSTDGDVAARSGGGAATGGAWLVKLSAKGELKWQKAIGGSYGDLPAGIMEDSGNGYYFAINRAFGAGYQETGALAIKIEYPEIEKLDE